MHRSLRFLVPLLFAAGMFFVFSHPVFAGDGCGEVAAQSSKAGKEDVEELEQKYSSFKRDTWTCQKIDLQNPNQGLRCVQKGCPNRPNNVLCCIPQTGDQGIDAADGTGGGAKAGSGFSGVISLPNCALTDGNCGLDDLVKMGVTFANFLLGLSGAIFLGIFVYAGLLYLLSGGDSNWAKQGKEMMKGAVIGMLIIFGAGTIVRFVYVSFTRQAPGPSQCEIKHAQHSCQVIGGGKEELEYRGCKTSGQGSDASLCSGTNVYCCPIDPPEPAPAGGTTPTPGKQTRNERNRLMEMLVPTVYAAKGVCQVPKLPKSNIALEQEINGKPCDDVKECNVLWTDFCNKTGGVTESCSPKGQPTCEIAKTDQAAPQKNDGTSAQLTNPLGDVTIQGLIGRLIRAVLGIVGALALAMFIYGGIMWLTAGDSKRVDTAKSIIKNAVIGMLILFFAYTLAALFIRAVTSIGVK